MSELYPLEVDVQTVKSLLDGDEDFLFVDCREQNEYDLVHINGAKHLPMGETAERVNEFEAYRDRRIVVHCHFGGRSLEVVQWLRQQGFAKAQSMAGGIDDWSIRIDGALNRY